jgi:hypothetical protein
MNKYNFDLVFLDETDVHSPAPVLSHVTVRNLDPNPYEPNRGHLLTRQCHSLVELENQINRLKQELDTVLAEARRKYEGCGAKRKTREPLITGSESEPPTAPD